jgi:acyltransferase 3
MRSLNFYYVAKLDHLRFFAAILVVYHHFRGAGIQLWDKNVDFSIASLLKIWLVQGSTGVSLFLVLSAFLFTLITHAGLKEINYKYFIYNRILRIFPLLIVLVFIVLTINRANSTPLDLLRIITLQLNTGNPTTGWGHEFFPIGPIWTIAVEFQFYLLFPFFMIFLRKFGIRYLLLLLSFILVTRFVVVSLNSQDIYYNLYHSIIGRLDQFVIGILLGVLYIRGYFTKLNNIYSFLCIFLALISLTFLMFGNVDVSNKYYSSVFYFSLEGLLWSLVILGYISFNLSHNKIINILSKNLAFLGSLSFSIYLLHLPIGIIVTNILSLSEPNSITESIINTSIRLPFIIAVSLLSFYAIEKPFMSLRVKYLRESESK